MTITTRIPNVRGTKDELIQLKMKKKNGLFSFRDHLYQIKKKAKLYTTFECHLKSKGCDAAIKLWKRGQEVTIIRDLHNHGWETVNIRAVTAKVDLFNLAKVRTTEFPRNLIGDVIPDDKDLAKYLPTQESLARLVQRGQVESRVVIRGDSIEDLVVEDIKLIRTMNGEPIFYKDSGFHNGARVIILSTPTLIDIFSQVEAISVDGTFDVRPRMFAKGQVWGIQGMINGEFIPLASCLLSGKSSAIYSTAIKMLPVMQKLQYVMLDFEKAEEKAFKEIYPRATIFGCFFHWKKCVSDKLSEYGLLPKKSNKMTPKRWAVRRLLYLPFVPKEYIIRAYENMMNVIEAFDLDPTSVRDVRAYMQRTWTGQVNFDARCESQRYSVPMYTYTRWNALLSLKKISEPTNNSHEAWNKTLETSIGILHSTGKPSLSRFCDCYKREITHAVLKIAGSIKKPPYPSNKARQLLECVQNFSIDKSNEYIDSIMAVFDETK